MTTARPILFSAPMVRALLEGRKTQTRRILKPQPPQWAVHCEQPRMLNVLGNWVPSGLWTWCEAEQSPPRDLRRWPIDKQGEHYWMRLRHGVPGDLLWVKETWSHTGTGVWSISDTYMALDGKVVYRADGDDGTGGWFSSIHMPRARSRLTLEITDVRVERLQDISEADAKAEGAMYHDGRGIGHSGWRHDFKDVHANCRSSYARLWNDINGPGSWDANPWVVALTFKVHTQNVDAVLATPKERHPGEGRDPCKPAAQPMHERGCGSAPEAQTKKRGCGPAPEAQLKSEPAP